MNHQGTEEDVASLFLNDSHQNASTSQQASWQQSPSPAQGFVQTGLHTGTKAPSPFQATKAPKVTAFICTMPRISKLFPSSFLIFFFLIMI